MGLGAGEGGAVSGPRKGATVTHQKAAAGVERSFDIPQANSGVCPLRRGRMKRWLAAPRLSRELVDKAANWWSYPYRKAKIATTIGDTRAPLW
jgi:hypothetical protein